MDGQERRMREKKGTRRDYYVLVGILVYIGSLLFRMPLLRIIGEEGVGYLGMVYELYIVMVFFLSYGLTEATASLVRYRIKREQYKNAGKVLREALIIAMIIGVLLCVGFMLGGNWFAEMIIGIPLCGLAISVMAPAILFNILTSVFKGYFQGIGSKVPTMHSKILEIVIMFIGGLLGASLFRDYGEKVSALLLNDSYAAAYGAMGASVGILLSSVFCFLHMLVLFGIYRDKVKKQEMQDMQRPGGNIAYILVRTMLPYGMLGMVFHSLPFLGGYLFVRFSENVNNIAVSLGKYYGKYNVVICIISALLTIMGVEPVRKIIYRLDREDYRLAREKVKILLHQYVIWTVPVAVFTAVLSNNLLDFLFQGNNRDVAGWIMWGSVGIVFYVFAILFSNMLIRLRKMKYVVAYGSLTLIIYCVAVGGLVKNTNLGIMALVIGNIIFYVILSVGGFLFISKSLQYSQEWVRTVAFPVVAAGIAGLIVMLLNKAFASLMGNVLSMVVCLPVGIAAYVILLLVIRSVNENELEDMIFGKILIVIGKQLHLM